MATRNDISTEKLNNYPQITCLEFRCDDLSKYMDSMLFNSHENEIAYAEFAHKGDIMNIRLEVNGYVTVEYDGSTYHAFNEFPEELKSLIKEHPCEWSSISDKVCVEENNWFEYLFGPKIADTNIYQDGEMYESDLSKASPQEIFDDMIELAVSYFGYDSSSAD